MKVLTAEQMSHADRETISRGTPGIDLMRNAGEAVFRVVSERFGKEDRIAVIAGRGNNGGDGFRVAELLARAEFPVLVFLAGEQSNIRGDAKICLNAYRASGGSVTELTSAQYIGEFTETISSCDCIVDALFGTGLAGDIDGLAGEIIDRMNDSGAYVIAVDIPSGVDASTGAIRGKAVRSDETVTFGCLKAGHVLKPGAIFCGLVHIADIGLSGEVMDSIDPWAETITLDEASLMMPRRPYDAYKSSVGRVAVIAGSVGMTGAAAMVSESALRTGAGMVTLGCPESLNDILEVKLTEVMTRPLPEVRKKRCLSLRAMGLVRELARDADVVALGPGLGRYFETRDLVRRFIAGFEGRLVLDADGIQACAGNPQVLKESKADIIVTPHFGELAALMGTDIAAVREHPREAAIEAANATGAVIILKGANTVIARKDETIFLNGTGNEGMATAGSGDVLTGIVTGLAAQGMDSFDAAVLGTFLHGLAGDRAAAEYTVPGMVAGNIIDMIPPALSDILDHTGQNIGWEDIIYHPVYL